MIHADNIRRSFSSVKKEEGFKGAIKLLTKPQHIEHEALKGVSFHIPEGGFVGLIGANGAGKTTLLKILSGLIPASSGKALVMGEDPFKRSMAFRRNIALVMGQKAQLWWDLPALDAFELLRAIYEIPLEVYKARVKELTTLLQVEKLLGTQIRRLSLGERMKMELIGALIHMPKIIFLDEPTIGLDILAASNLREFLREYNLRQKSTIILTSHNMDDVEKLCSRILILKEGAMIFDGSPKTLTQEGSKTLRLRLVEKPTISELARTLQISEKDVTQGQMEEGENEVEVFKISLPQNEIPKAVQLALNHFTVADLGVEEVSLEHVIESIYSNKLHLHEINQP